VTVMIQNITGLKVIPNMAIGIKEDQEEEDTGIDMVTWFAC